MIKSCDDALAGKDISLSAVHSKRVECPNLIELQICLLKMLQIRSAAHTCIVQTENIHIHRTWHINSLGSPIIFHISSELKYNSLLH